MNVPVVWASAPSGLRVAAFAFRVAFGFVVLG